jgi:hypothetical protein
MFRGVAIRRRVTATHVSASQAKPQVDPGRTNLQTFLTPVRARNNVGIDLLKMRAFFEVHEVIVLAILGWSDLILSLSVGQGFRKGSVTILLSPVPVPSFCFLSRTGTGTAAIDLLLRR